MYFNEMLSRKIFILALFVFASAIPLKEAESYEISRPALVSLARDFVARIGKKLQGTGTEESILSNIPENEVLIFRPRIAEKIMVEANIAGLRRGDFFFLSFREFCEGLNFPLQINTEKLSAQGWFIAENQPFLMDLHQSYVQSRGVRFDVSEDEWFRENGDLFVSIDSILKWMGIDSVIDTEELLLDLSSDVPFPLEEKLARRKRNLEKSDTQKEPILPRIDSPHRLAGIPNVDVTLSASVDKDHHEKATSTLTQTIVTSGDFLAHTTRGIALFNRNHGLESFRVTAERKSENADLLGPLKAHKYILGDISPTELSGTGSGDSGLGVRVTNAEDHEISGSTIRTFEGDVPPDWDVELYDGEQLIDFQTVGAEGRYQFTDVELYAGENDFRLVFFGPQGEIREEAISIPVNLEDVGADKKLYDVSLTLNHLNTYSYYPNEDVDKGIPHLVISYEQGIRDGLSMTAGLRVQQAEEKWKTVAKGGLIARWGKMLFNADLITDETFDSSLELAARRNFGDHALRTTHSFSTSKFDPDNGGGETTTYRGELGLRGPLPPLFGNSLSYALDARYSELAGGTNNISVDLAQNLRLGSYTLGHALNFDRVYDGEDQTQDIGSVFSIRGSIGLTRIRTSARYLYFPERELDNLTLNINRYLRDNIQGEVEIKREIKPDRTEGMAQMNWRNDHFTLSPRITYDTDHDLTATVNMRFGLAYDPIGHILKMSNETLGNSGSVHAFVFLDKNGNGKFDHKDEPLPEVKVMGVQIARGAETDENGVAFIHNLPEYEPTDIVLDTSTLGDPYYVSGFDGLSTYPRPGKTVQIDFPVHLSGEMDGTIYKPGRDGPSPASGLRLQLFDPTGRIVMSSLTAFDGYYVISVIPPGDYLLMVHPDDLYKSNLRQSWPRKISVGYDGKVLAGEDIYLEQGAEIPVRFLSDPAKNIKNKNQTQPDQNIELRLGVYQSDLLGEVMKLRIRQVLDTNNKEEISRVQTRPIALENGNTGIELFTVLPADRLNLARGFCRTLVESDLACTIMVDPRQFL